MTGNKSLSGSWTIIGTCNKLGFALKNQCVLPAFSTSFQRDVHVNLHKCERVC